MTAWQQYNEKFDALTSREKYLIIITGLIAIVLVFYSLFLDGAMQEVDKFKQQIRSTSLSSQNDANSIALLEQSLANDPNAILQQELEQYQQKLAKTDSNLLALASELIDPVQMRHALIKLLKLQSGVSLLSFEVLPVTLINEQAAQATEQEQVPLVVEQSSSVDEQQQVQLYKHGMRIKLQGSYFKLRDYLAKVEAMPWMFYWQKFDYQLTQYPNGVLEIEIYSLSTVKEFIGV